MSHKAEALSKVAAYVGRHDGRVEFMDNWHKRGGSRFDPKGFTVHHDASPRGSDIRHIIRDGHSTLSGPLANLYLTRKGALVVIAAGRANHAGRGGWQGLRGNSSVWGLEIANDGTGEPYGDEQLRVVRLLMRAFHEVDGVPVGLVHSHAEWAPRRKTDPAVDPEVGSRPWNMARFRSELRQQPDPEPDERWADTMIRIWHGRDTEDRSEPAWWLVVLSDLEYRLLGDPATIDTWTRRVESDGDPDVIGHSEPVDKARASWFAGLDRAG